MWVRALELASLPPGEVRPFTYHGREFVLCNHAGEIRALDGECPHANGPLAQGNFVDGFLVCPWHAWEFDTATGLCPHNSRAAVRRYETEVREGAIFIRLA